MATAKKVRFTNINGQKIVTSVASLVEMKKWLASNEQRQFIDCTGTRFTTSPERIVRVEKFTIRVGAARFFPYWSR